MLGKKIRLKYKKERSVLSDVLPYEIPIIFSNYHFYSFLLRNKVEFTSKNIRWLSDSNDKVLDIIILLLFGIPISKSNLVIVDSKDEKILNNTVFKLYPTNEVPWKSIPFFYKIRHKENEYRELAVPHPKNQLQVANFYYKHKELILYYCSLSPFSIRYPERVAKYIYCRDKTRAIAEIKKSMMGLKIYKHFLYIRNTATYPNFMNQINITIAKRNMTIY